jgi:hypothetical protein
MTIAELAKKYKHGTEFIREVLKKNNIHIRSLSENAILKKTNYQYSLQEIEEEVIKQYSKGNGLIKSGKKFGLSAENVKYILKKNGIKIRNFSEAAKVSNSNRAYNKNIDFFSEETRDTAWLLGFLAADGALQEKNNTIKLGLSQKDEEILIKIKEKVAIENPIRYYTTNKGYDIVELEWTCDKHKKDLAKYHIVPNKTFKLSPPYNLNRKYWIDYIRGYFDGDGSVNLIKSKRGQGSLRWQICSMNKDFLQWIVDYLFDEFQIPKVNIQKQTKNRKTPLYYFQYSSVSTRKIYKILYTESEMFLLRKKKHFEEILSVIKPLYE